MEEWTIADLDFSVDDFTMECAYDLLTAFVYKSGQYAYHLITSPPCQTHHQRSVKVHLLKLSDGKPHPRAKMPLLEYEIPLTPTEHGWELEVVIWGDQLGCLFTSAFENEWVDNLVVWNWTTGDLVRVRAIIHTHPFFVLHSTQVLSLCGNRAFVFLDERTIVAGRSMENGGPSLSFFDLSSDEKPTNPLLTLSLPDEGGEEGGSLRIRLNLGLPIYSGPELRVRVPFFVDPSQQMLFIFTFFVDYEGDLVAEPHSITMPLPVLRSWARTGVSCAGWNEWNDFPVDVQLDDTYRATFTMGSRFVTTNIYTQSPATATSIPLLVYDLNPHRLMRVGWEPSGPHCRGISGVWNTVTQIPENGSDCRTIEARVEPASNLLMTEDGLVAVANV